MLLLTDVDGVLLDWFSQFKSFIHSKNITPTADRPSDWSLKDWLPDHDIVGLISEFNSSEAFGDLPPLPDAMAAIPQLRKMGYRLVAVTSCSSEHGVVQRRRENLIRHFGHFEDIICLPLGTRKLDVLELYHPTWWVEDRFEHALEGVEAGHKAVLLNRPHNQHLSHPGLIRAQDWHEILVAIQRD